MENYIILSVVIVLAGMAKYYGLFENEGAATKKKKTYHYRHKEYLMTRAEADFFQTLHEAVGSQYYVFPQIHLPSIIDHKVKGQTWSAAFRHINGKSVDYVLCDKSNLKPVAVIELDDSSHSKTKRRKRDKEVERIFEEANLPLVRFLNKDLSTEEVKGEITNIIHS